MDRPLVVDDMEGFYHKKPSNPFATSQFDSQDDFLDATTTQQQYHHFDQHTGINDDISGRGRYDGEIDSCGSDDDANEINMESVLEDFNTRLVHVLQSMQQELRSGDSVMSVRSALHVSGIVQRAVRRAADAGSAEVPYLEDHDHKRVVESCLDGSHINRTAASKHQPSPNSFQPNTSINANTVATTNTPSHQQLKAAISDLSAQDPSPSASNRTLRQIGKVLGGAGTSSPQQLSLPEDERGLILLRLQLLAEDASEIREKIQIASRSRRGSDGGFDDLDFQLQTANNDPSSTTTTKKSSHQNHRRVHPKEVAKESNDPFGYMDELDTYLGDCGEETAAEAKSSATIIAQCEKEERARRAGVSSYPSKGLPLHQRRSDASSAASATSPDRQRRQAQMISRLRRSCQELSERSFQTSHKLRVSEAQREELVHRLNAREETLRGLKNHFLRQVIASIGGGGNNASSSGGPAGGVGQQVLLTNNNVVSSGTAIGRSNRVRGASLAPNMSYSNYNQQPQHSGGGLDLATTTASVDNISSSPPSQLGGARQRRGSTATTSAVPTPAGVSLLPPPPPLPAAAISRGGATPPPHSTSITPTSQQQQQPPSSILQGTPSPSSAQLQPPTITNNRIGGSTGLTPLLGPSSSSAAQQVFTNRELASNIARMAGIPVDFVESLDLEVARRSANVALEMEKLKGEHSGRIQKQRDGYRRLLEAKEKEIVQMQLLFRNALRALQGTHANVVSRMTNENADLRQSNLEGEQTAMQKAEEYYELKMNEKLASLTQQYEGRIAYLTDNLKSTNGLLGDAMSDLKTSQKQREKLQKTVKTLEMIARHASEVEVPFAMESGAMGIQTQLLTTQTELRELKASARSSEFQHKEAISQLREELAEGRKELLRSQEALRKTQSNEVALQSEIRKLQARENTLQGALADQNQKLASAHLQADQVKRTNSFRPIETDAQVVKRLQEELDLAVMDATSAKSDAETLSNELRATRDQLEDALGRVAMVSVNSRPGSPSAGMDDVATVGGGSTSTSPRNSTSATPRPLSGGVRRRQSSGVDVASQEELSKLRAEVTSLQSQLEAALRDLEDLKKIRRQESIAAKSTEQELLERIANLHARYDSASSMCDEYKKGVEEMRKTVMDREDEVDDAYEQIESLGRDVKALEELVVKLGGRIPDKSSGAGGSSRPTSGRPPSAPRGGRPPTPNAPRASISRPASPLCGLEAPQQHDPANPLGISGSGNAPPCFDTNSSSMPHGVMHPTHSSNSVLDVVGLVDDGGSVSPNNSNPTSRAHTPSSSSLVRKYSSLRGGVGGAGGFGSASRLFRMEVPTVSVGINTSPTELSLANSHRGGASSPPMSLFSRPNSAFDYTSTPRGGGGAMTFADAATSDRYLSGSLPMSDSHPHHSHTAHRADSLNGVIGGKHLLDALNDENALLRYRLSSLHTRMLFAGKELNLSQASILGNLVSEFDLDVDVVPSSVKELEEEIRAASRMEASSASMNRVPPRPSSAATPAISTQDHRGVNHSGNIHLRPQSATVLARSNRESHSTTTSQQHNIRPSSVLTSRSLTPAPGQRPASAFSSTGHGGGASSSGAEHPLLLELLPVPTTNSGSSSCLEIALQNRAFHNEVKRRAAILEDLCRGLVGDTMHHHTGVGAMGGDAMVIPRQPSIQHQTAGKSYTPAADPSRGKYHISALPPSKPTSRPGSGFRITNTNSTGVARRKSAFGVELADDGFVYEDDHTGYLAEDFETGDIRRYENYGDAVIYEKHPFNTNDDEGELGPDFVVAIPKSSSLSGSGVPQRPQSARTAGAYSVASRLPMRGRHGSSPSSHRPTITAPVSISADQHAPTSSYIQASSYFDVKSRVERISSDSEPSVAAIRKAAQKGLLKGRPTSAASGGGHLQQNSMLPPSPRRPQSAVAVEGSGGSGSMAPSAGYRPLPNANSSATGAHTISIAAYESARLR